MRTARALTVLGVCFDAEKNCKKKMQNNFGGVYLFPGCILSPGGPTKS